MNLCFSDSPLLLLGSPADLHGLKDCFSSDISSRIGRNSDFARLFPLPAHSRLHGLDISPVLPFAPENIVFSGLFDYPNENRLERGR